MAEYDNLASATPKFKFIYAADTRIAMIDDQGDVHFYLNDHLGSARRVIAENGLMQESYTYWAFGASRKESIAKNQAYRYTGKPFDDNESLDLYYYGARYYDTDGRFTAIDPLARMYPGWSPYVYTLNNPLKYIDPDGRSVGTAIRVVLKWVWRTAKNWGKKKIRTTPGDQTGKKAAKEIRKTYDPDSGLVTDEQEKDHMKHTWIPYPKIPDPVDDSEDDMDEDQDDTDDNSDDDSGSDNTGEEKKEQKTTLLIYD